jgi:hypothetical protein
LGTHSSANSTSRFLGPEEDWPAARLALRDVHGLWGGQELDLDGAGQGTARLVARTGDAQQYVLSVPPERVAALLRQMIAVDFLTIPASERSGVPDEARPEIALTNPAGERSGVARWAGDPNPAFSQIYQALSGLIREAAGES